MRFFHDALELLERLGSNVGDMPFDKGKSLFDHQQQTRALFYTLYVDTHRLSLYGEPGSRLPLAAGRVLQHAWDAQREFSAHFSKVKRAIMAEEQAFIFGDKGAYAQRVSESNVSAKSLHAALDPHVKEMVRSCQEYIRVLNGHLRDQGRAPVPNQIGPV